MLRALEQAQHSVGMASPNPAVGCVLVQGGRAVGSGYHEYDKRDHAEVVALRAAGGEARGATAYVTLEPCSHTGRTGPCADALVAAGVSRVVAATGDPNPAVNGQGLAKLRAAGVEVTVGVCAGRAQALNDGFAAYIRRGKPFVTLKSAVTLDGRIAPAPSKATQGKTYWITGEESRALVQRMRHASDALVTGINSVLNDNPLLSDRSGLPRRRPLLRVVLDSALRIRLDSSLVRSAKDDVLVFCTSPVVERVRSLEALGVRVERLEAEPGMAGRVSLKRVMERLGEMEMTSVMIEAGSQINGSALIQGLVDKLSLFYAPSFLGSKGVPMAHGLDDYRPQVLRATVTPSGKDFLFQGYLRDPWA